MAAVSYPYVSQDELLSLERYEVDALPTKVAESVMPFRHGHKTIAFSLFLLGVFLFLTAVDFHKLPKDSVPLQSHMHKAQGILTNKINKAFDLLNQKVGTENMAVSARMTLFASALVMLVTGGLSFIFSVGHRFIHKRRYPSLRRASSFGMREMLTIAFIALAILAARVGLENIKGLYF